MFVYILNIEYDRVNANKITGLLECIIWHYWYFLEIKFRLLSKVCYGFLNENHSHYYYKMFYKNVHINNIEILYYDETDLSEGIGVNKTSLSKECIVSDYYFFR